MAKSSRKETYVVQPFAWRGRNLQARDAIRVDSEVKALRKGEELRTRYAGVSIMAVEVAEDVDWCGEPRLVASFGDVPRAA